MTEQQRKKKVGSLRNKAKKAYRTFMDRVDHLDCGIQLAIYMVADASELAHKFDNYLCELEKLGEPIKSNWYLIGKPQEEKN